MISVYFSHALQIHERILNKLLYAVLKIDSNWFSNTNFKAVELQALCSLPILIKDLLIPSYDFESRA